MDARSGTRERSWLLQLVLAGALACLFLASASPAQPEDAAPKVDPVQAVEEALRTVASEIADLEGEADGGPDSQRELLTRLEHSLGQHLNELRRAEDLASQTQAEPELPSQIHGDPPYRLAAYDEAGAAAQRAQSELAQLEKAAATARSLLENARSELDTRERERRRAKEAELPELAKLQLQSRIARAAAALRETELANTLTALALQQKRASRAQEAEAWVGRHLVVSPEDERATLAPYDAEEARLRRRLERAELDLQEAKSRWKSAQERIRIGALDAESEEGLALLRARLSLHQKDVALLGEAIDRLTGARETLRRRLAVLGGSIPERKQLRAWLAEARATLQGLDRDRSLDLAETTALEQELNELEKKAGDANASATLRAHAGTLRARVALHQANVTSLDAARQDQRRLIAELERQVGSLTLRDRLAKLAGQTRSAWGYELFASGDQPVTVGKLSMALTLIVVGLLLASRLASISEQKILPRFGFDSGASHAFAALGFYVLLVVVFLLSLRTVNIPLTAFAILGGAVAIGVGFGSQNIVNNFISGIILLAERPIKIGDLIQVEETYGNVERIGLRSTRIRTGENIHFILPNSTLLENRVVNWTHNDSQVRIKLSVGVIYGSPTRKVEELIHTALAEHKRVLKSPTPIILFNNFGDNSLDFSAHFWVAVRSYMDRLRIESELRYCLDESFREAGIVIAFPQRDVHLDAAAPLEIRLVNGSAPPPEKPA